MKRKKRLIKGIDSLQEQIDAHLVRFREAEKAGDEELARYLDKDLIRLEKDQKKKKEKLEKI